MRYMEKLKRCCREEADLNFGLDPSASDIQKNMINSYIWNWLDKGLYAPMVWSTFSIFFFAPDSHALCASKWQWCFVFDDFPFRVAQLKKKSAGFEAERSGGAA